MTASDPLPLQWTPELVASFWNGLARAGLDEQIAFGRLNCRPIHWVIARHLSHGGKHLDYGAGGGEIAAHLIAQGFPFAIFEPSAERRAKTEARLAGLPGFLGGPDHGPFDVVTCFEVLEHILDPDFDRVCDEIASYVRSGGKLIVSTPNNEDLARDTVYCPVSNVTFHRWQHVRQVSPALMTEVWSKRGFKKIALHQLDFASSLFEPYLHMMGLRPGELQEGEIIPLHIHQVMNDIDSVMGGASRILYVGAKSP